MRARIAALTSRIAPGRSAGVVSQWGRVRAALSVAVSAALSAALSVALTEERVGEVLMRCPLVRSPYEEKGSAYALFGQES